MGDTETVMDTTLSIHRPGEMPRLYQIADTVTGVRIINGGRITSLHLPPLPPQVKTLIIENHRVEEPLRFEEGLETLELRNITVVGSMANWIFPASLQRIKIGNWNQDLDLRTVTAPTITLFRSGGASYQVRLPEALDDLVINGRSALGGVQFPPYLRKLSLGATSNLPGLSQVSPSVIDLSLNSSMIAFDFDLAFPELEVLKLRDYAPVGVASLRLSRLRELTLAANIGDRPLVIDCPELESLLVAGTAWAEPDLSAPGSSFGQTLTRLELKLVSKFPAAREWERLTSLAVSNSEVELPFIRWLDELVTDRPLLTNGVMVETLDEYKQAWGFTKTAKRAQF